MDKILQISVAVEHLISHFVTASPQGEAFETVQSENVSGVKYARCFFSGKYIILFRLI